MLPSMLLLRMLCLLMLMFLLRDADSACPFESNPVNVQPAVAVEEYGGHFYVNCTSDNEDYKDAIWKVGKEGVLTEDEKKLPSLNLSLTDWNMTVECIININDTHECSKGVDLTIYKNPEVVLSVINVQALGEETLYELKCDVLNVAPVQYLSLRWYTNDELSKTDSLRDTTRTPVNESRTLNLTVRREDDVVKVRCEAQLDFRQNENLRNVSQTYNVSAHYAPELKMKNDTEDVYVVEGTDISLNCDAEGNPPPVFNWTRDGLSVPVDTDIFNITQVNTGSVYICTATNYLGNKTKHFHIHVTNKKIEATSASAPIPKVAETGCAVTLTPPEVVVRFGDRVSVNCSALDVDGLGWESTVGGIGFERVTFQTWTVEKLENWNENASCYASVDDGQCQKYVDITIYQTPDTVSIWDDGPMLEGTQYQLQCDINNVAPVQKLKVKWYRAAEIVFEDTFSDTTLTPVNVTSNLTIIPTKEDNGALFRCHAELHLGPSGPEFPPHTTSEPYAAVVYYKPIINSCALHHSVVEHEYSLDMLPCNVDGNPPPTIKWYYKDKEVMNSSELLSRNDSGNYRAEFENRMGVNRVPVDITVEYGPSFTCKKSYDVEVNGKLQCEPEGIPTPRLTWFKDGKEIVPPQSWTKQDSGEYLIKASNNHGEASHMLYVNILYPPELTTGQLYATNEVGNVTRSVALMMKGTPDFTYTVIWVPIIAGIIVMMIVAVVIYRNHKKKWGLYTFVSNVDHHMTTMTTSMS